MTCTGRTIPKQPRLLSCLQALLPQAELQELVQSYPAYSFVVDFSGDVVAALVSRPVKVRPCTQIISDFLH